MLRHAHAHRPDVFTHFIPEWDENIDLALDWLSICGHLLFDLDEEVEEVEGVRCGIGNLGFVLSVGDCGKRDLGSLLVLLRG